MGFRSCSVTVVLTLMSSVLGACGTVTKLPAPPKDDPPPVPLATAVEACPAEGPAPRQLPGVQQKHRSAAYWVERYAKPDAVVLTSSDIANQNQAFRAQLATQPGEHMPLLGQRDLLWPTDRVAFLQELQERVDYMREHVQSGKYLDVQGARLAGDALLPFAEVEQLPPLKNELRIALAAVPLRCGPRRAGLYKGPDVDRAFDRNNCSTIRAQEVVEILASPSHGVMLARTPYALGWIASDAPLSPPLTGERAIAYVRGEKLRIAEAVTLNGASGHRLKVEPFTMLPRGASGGALFATATGFDESQPLTTTQARRSKRPLTRRALFEEAFSYYDTRYGWGGQEEGRDCSRFLMDVFSAFGVQLPRHSGLQAKAGSMTIDVAEVESESERLAFLDAAAARGIVLLHFPGHIMLYLGRDEDGQPVAIHAFAEYLERCESPHTSKSGDERSETLRRVEQIQVSTLSLGKGTSRRSFLERLTKISLFAQTPGQALLGAVQRRPAAPLSPTGDTCEKNDEVHLFTSPQRAYPGAPLRVVATSAHDLGSVKFTLRDPNGKMHVPVMHDLGGPPFSYWVSVSAPMAGKWTAYLGEGEKPQACVTVEVKAKPPPRRAGAGPVWISRRQWNEATENLYSAFVEQLFDYPPHEDLTWPNLQELLTKTSKNILHNHLGQGEDDELKLQPDCADLPYFLRAYFSWKLRLPFAYRLCNRGRSGKAPYCDRDLKSNLSERENAGELSSFSHFARRSIADGVHSGSGRTGPDDERSDYYPVPLTREALRPGTVFADPYGHILVVADWVPQGVNQYGVLVGADAQPDGTIGRRRFWRGSFLFKPETEESGAGFKSFRPLRYRGGRVRPIKNADLDGSRGLNPFSKEQYQHGISGFYERVEALINPRPLEASKVMLSLVDALDEAVQRRVVSVNNSVVYTAENSKTIKMPHGHAIFETTGPWENYSTPSRDMRLLIAVDTVMGFPDLVKRNPQRFGLGASATALEKKAADLRAQLDGQLAGRKLQYKRSDGSTFDLTLRDVVARRQAFEMAYNPNDCVEVRWAAIEGSAERSTCQRRAPQRQRDRMAKYRVWFAERRRPPR